jgi:hypothetical protein
MKKHLKAADGVMNATVANLHHLYNQNCQIYANA